MTTIFDKGMSHTSILHRLKAGLSIEEALTKPLKSNVRSITAFGETRTVKKWAEHLGINYSTLANRIRRGMTPEEAISKPLKVAVQKSN